VNTIKVSGTGDTDTRVAALEQAVNYGEVILPFPVVDETEGGGTGGPPSGPASGDLSGTYPAPQIAPGVIVDADVNAAAGIQGTKLANAPNGIPTAKLNDGAVTRVKTAPDCWLSPIPVDPANVGQTLTVDPGPVLAWKDPAVTQGLSGTWNWKATAAVADPGAGNLNPDNLATPTILCFSTMTVSGTDARNVFATTQVGDILVAQQKTDSTKWAKFQVRAALVDHTTWFEVPITVLANGPGGAVANNANVVVSFQRSTGTTGPTGPAGGDLSGSYPAPQIAAGAVGNAEISDVAWGKVTSVPAGLVNWRGGWVYSSAYAKNDVVMYQGSAWVATGAIPAPAAFNIAQYAQVAFEADSLALTDGAEVLAWTNAGSGGGTNNATGSAGAVPTWVSNQVNGKPVVRFPTGSKMLSVPNVPVIASALSYLAVTRHAAASSYPMVVSDGAIELRCNGSSLLPEWSVISTYVTGATPIVTGFWHILAGTFGNGTLTGFLDGTSFGSTSLASITAGTRTIGLGQRPANPGLYPFVGDLAAVAIVTTTLTVADRQRIEGYFAWEYGLVANLPANHPYKNDPPVSVYEPGIDARWERMAAGVVPGGTAAQVLQKATGSDYDVAWTTPAALTYRHVQATAATTWSITHNLSFRPNVTAVDSTGRAIWPGALDYPSATAVTLTFSAAVGGEAYLS
jgi:hypothetical protein